MKVQRTIQEVLFEELGPLTVQELLAMPVDGWVSLRSGITDHRNGKKGLVARCVLCHGPVYIRNSMGRPLFAHFNGSNPDCPWYLGPNLDPNDVKQKQYHGQQESETHRRICELIRELCSQDYRFIRATVDDYLPPTQNAFGRYPDVLVEWRDFGVFAVEYQMSYTFQTEVSQRCLHYEREGIQLLWILSSFDPSFIPQPVMDVVHRHRGNAFVLDQNAVFASREQKTLVLSCYQSNGDGFDLPTLIRFDALTFPKSHLPFLEDRLVGPLLAKIIDRRAPYAQVIGDWGDRLSNLPLTELADFPNRYKVDRLIAAAFSVVGEAEGQFKKLASGHENNRGMLNTYLNSGTLAPYARLLTALIEKTSVNGLLSSSVGRHLKESINGHRHGHIEQVDENSREWRLLRELFPELLDPFVRHRLEVSERLPHWATPHP